MPRRYFSQVPAKDMPSGKQLLAVYAVMIVAVAVIIILHPTGQ
jgi:diacylglycerol kinase